MPSALSSNAKTALVLASIALAFFHGLSHSELAAHLRKPLGTVKTHVRRGLMRLKDCLMREGVGA